MEILIKISAFLLAAPIIFLLVKYLLVRSRSARIFIIFFHAIVLTFLTLFLFNQPFWRWTDQVELIREVRSHASKSKAYNYIWDNFILVDNSFDKDLILNPDGDQDDSTNIIVTNRGRLSAFLELLNEHINYVDLVVCDIGFEESTTADSLLEQRFLKIYGEKKLLLSIEAGKPKSRVMNLGENMYGNIMEKGDEKLFVSHTIKNNNYFSLPYKLYANLNRLEANESFFFNALFMETDTLKKTSTLVSNTFFPEFYLTDERLLQGRNHKSRVSSSIDLEEGFESDNHTFYYLSEPLSPAGKKEFVNNLIARKRKGQHNIIFLGAFSSRTEDIHQTIYADLHGPTILLNIFYALQQGRHQLNFLFILLLLTGYSIISWVLIYRSLGLNLIPEKYHLVTGFSERLEKKLKKYKGLDLLSSVITFLFDFVFVEELHLVLLLCLILIVKSTSGQLINAMSLLIYLAVISALLKYARKNIVPVNVEKAHLKQTE